MSAFGPSAFTIKRSYNEYTIHYHWEDETASECYDQSQRNEVHNTLYSITNVINLVAHRDFSHPLRLFPQRRQSAYYSHLTDHFSDAGNSISLVGYLLLFEFFVNFPITAQSGSDKISIRCP